MEHRAHVCLFTASPEPSGIGEHMLALAAELRSHVHLSFGCIPNAAGRDLLGRAAALGLECLALDGRGTLADAEIARLRDWLREREVDVFHIHAGVGWEGHTVTWAARQAGVPVVVRTEHLPYVLTVPEEQETHRRLMEAVDCLICVSAGARASFAAAGVPPGKLRVVRNGIVPQPSTAPRHVARRALGLPSDMPIALTIARFTEQKGHRLLLAAIPAVLVRRPGARFLWVGEGPLKPEMEEAVAALGLDDRVRFLGQRSDVAALMAAADLFVLPSMFEGLPLVALEAMAAGLPVVGTRVCGTDEVVVDGETGRLVEGGHAPALADAVSEVLADPSLAARWGAAGRRRVADEFTAARMARETLAVYETLRSGVWAPDHANGMVALGQPRAKR
jgi:glycosyltransferase involved in cell wall biosynthesis